MTKEELIEYAIRSSEAIQEERKPELIDYFYKQLDKLKKQKEIIDKIFNYLEEHYGYNIHKGIINDTDIKELYKILELERGVSDVED